MNPVYSIPHPITDSNKIRKRHIKEKGEIWGFTDVYKSDGRETETRAAGPNAWVHMALNYYIHKTGDPDNPSITVKERKLYLLSPKGHYLSNIILTLEKLGKSSYFSPIKIFKIQNDTDN